MKKWMIVYDKYCIAVDKVAAAVQPYLPYVPICGTHEDTRYNCIKLQIDPLIKGFIIDVSESDGENQQITLIGENEINLYYAACDFQNIYIPFALEAQSHSYPYYFNEIFTRPLKPYNLKTHPRIKDRGIWLWGYTIYDYRRFIENMASLKLNTLIVWNDHLPVNVQQMIDYAHTLGIKVYLGFAWGWENNFVPDISRWEDIAEDVIKTYRQQYENINCDGIYFQTFTEHSKDVINGVVVAEAAVNMVNRIGRALLQEKADLKLFFGLHYTSVSKRLDTIAQVDERISVIWEDVGAFPYHYLPGNIEGFEETAGKTKQLQALRGGFGAVLKGVTALDWTTFKHLDGSYVLGASDKRFVKFKAGRQRNILRYIQSYWIKNAKYAHKLIKTFNENAMVTCLVEDGIFEEIINYPTALYAAMLWDSERNTEDILFETARRPDVDFV